MSSNFDVHGNKLCVIMIVEKCDISTIWIVFKSKIKEVWLFVI